jgi:hypothetical protein
MNSVEPKRPRKHAFDLSVARWHLLGHLHEAAGLPVFPTAKEIERYGYPDHYRTPPYEATPAQAKAWARRLAAYLFGRRAVHLPEAVTRHADTARSARDVAHAWVRFLNRCGGYEVQS